MQVRDARDAVSIETVFAEIWEHIKSATNNGKILPTITVFQPETSRHSIKILNHQLFRYAGYETENRREQLLNLFFRCIAALSLFK